jgi:hypothetical protein
MTRKRGQVIPSDTFKRILDTDTRGLSALLNEMAEGTDPNHAPDKVLSRIMGLTPPKPRPPDDMPAIEKIKLYARSGYNLHHIGTDEDFERVWEEAFPEEKGGKK